MRVCVTGLAGFIGSHVADHLIAAGHEVFGVDSMIGGEEDNIPAVVADWGHLDCRELEPHHFTDIDVVVHCAALAHEGLSVFSPKIISDNVMGASVAVFSAAIAGGVKRIVNLSSMSRYGDGRPPFREDDVPEPVDPYGIAKLAAERTLACLAKAHGIEHVTVIPHNAYGPRQFRSDPYRNVIAICMNRILQGKAPIIYGDGNQTRCFSYVDDVAPIIAKIATGMRPEWNGEVFNIGPDSGEITINELVSMIGTAMGERATPMHYPERPCEVRQAYCSSDKARRVLGYNDTISLQRGLRRMATWMKSVGPKAFNYHLPLEIVTDKTPKTWTERYF